MRKKGSFLTKISLSYILIIPFIAQALLCFQIYLAVHSATANLPSNLNTTVLLSDEIVTAPNNIFLANSLFEERSAQIRQSINSSSFKLDSYSLKQQFEAYKKNQIVLLLLSVAVAIYQFFTSKWLMNRFKQLEQTADAIATGDLTKKLNMHTVVEFSNLSNSLNAIVDLLVNKEKDVTKRTAALEASNQYLYCLANIDSLTEVANRRRFDEYLDKEWLKAAQTGEAFSLIMCDIDCFKFFNDDYGHLEGDNCLKQVAATLEAALPHNNHLLARYGGEEFALVLPNTHCREASLIAENLRVAIKNLNIPHPLSSVTHHVTISLGVSCVRASEDIQVKTLITNADRALYQAKTQGRDRVCVYNNSCVCRGNFHQDS